jgi:hypothetical protein
MTRDDRKNGYKRGSLIATLLAASVAAGPTQAQDRLIIGAAISKTGWNAPYDSPVMDGFAVALDEFNKAGGIAENSRSKSSPPTIDRTTPRTPSPPRI